MAVTVSHPFNCAIGDDADDAAAGKVLPSHWNASHTVTNALDKTGDTMTGTLNSTLGAITANKPALSVTQEWNSAGVTFHANPVTITRTAYAAGSTLAYWDSGVTSLAVICSTSGVVALGKLGNTIGTFRLGDLGNCYFYASNESICGIWTGVNADSRFAVDSKGSFAWSQTQNDATDTRDTQLSRNAAGVVEVNNGTQGTLRDIKVRNAVTPGVTVANLAGAAQGARSFVTDATQTMTAGIGAVVVGGGGNAVPVFYDGTNWRIG